MKDPENGLLKSMLPWDTSMIDRFIEIVIDDTLLTKTVKVTRYKGKNR
jgi:Arc/MetJ family transcription regulator